MEARRRSLFVGGTDYTGVGLDVILAHFKDWRASTDQTIRNLERYQKQVRAEQQSYDHPQEIIEYVDAFNDLFGRYRSDIDRLIRELPNGVMPAHLEALNQICESSHLHEPICVRFSTDHVNRRLKDESTRWVLDGIYADSRDQILDYYDLSNVRYRLEALVGGPPKPTRTAEVDIEEEYDQILDVLRSMALVMERTPGAFETLEEESIRTHFLVQLNGRYKGRATGETFNAIGKTDILVRVENKNLFIAECKFWKGPKTFDAAIGQLLSYLTWRDSKAALLVFNRGRNSASVRKKMHKAMLARKEFRKTLFHNTEGDSRYILAKTSEPEREIIITTQLYDVPTK